MQLVETLQALHRFVETNDNEVILKHQNVKDLLQYISTLENEGLDTKMRLKKLEKSIQKESRKSLDFYA